MNHVQSYFIPCELKNVKKKTSKQVHVPGFELLTFSCLTVKAASEAATMSPNLTIMKL